MGLGKVKTMFHGQRKLRWFLATLKAVRHFFFSFVPLWYYNTYATSLPLKPYFYFQNEIQRRYGNWKLRPNLTYQHVNKVLFLIAKLKRKKKKIFWRGFLLIIYNSSFNSLNITSKTCRQQFSLLPPTGFFTAGSDPMSSTVSFVQEVDVWKQDQSVTSFCAVIIIGEDYTWLKYIVVLLASRNSHQKKTEAPYHM